MFLMLEYFTGYSAHTVKHYNHTQIHRGVCVTSTCQQYLHEANTTMDLTDTLEACLNDSLWNEYQIEGKLAKLRYCKRENDRRGVDESDIIVAVVYLALILLNITGSFYDINYFTKEEKTGNPYLMAFSMRRNWTRLVSPAYEDPFKQILFNGSLVTYTFFVMSAFLMAYNFQLHAEKHAVSWLQWPKGMLQRWLSAFLLHTIFQRGLVGSMRAPVHVSDYFVVCIVTEYMNTIETTLKSPDLPHYPTKR
ncbi:hypothetical protein OBRU01_12313 [Operophtera brumata]|uniref:Uncharacterized protein n=1 Tax=Operophtera brumata TaxID=104452 RepID=A0A0L7LA61_OPEBR|nr:hypothetical protein OBRU01_12313 [Operophtera brumata]